MRIHLLLLVLAYTACTSSTKPPENQVVPAAFQERSVLQDVKSSAYTRGSSDLVETLFQEELKRDTALAALVERMQKQDRTHPDSMVAVNDYLSRNASYYQAAAQHGKSINDSLLALPILEKVKRNQAHYDLSVAEHEQWMQRYDSMRTRTQDLLTVVKLDRTLRIMRAYQDSNRPPTTVLQREVQRMTALERELRMDLGN